MIVTGAVMFSAGAVTFFTGVTLALLGFLQVPYIATGARSGAVMFSAGAVTFGTGVTSGAVMFSAGAVTSCRCHNRLRLCFLHLPFIPYGRLFAGYVFCRIWLVPGTVSSRQIDFGTAIQNSVYDSPGKPVRYRIGFALRFGVQVMVFSNHLWAFFVCS